MSEHRVSMLGASWRRFEDPTRSRDPRVRAVIGALATLPAPAPSAQFRAELRAQLVAITPRLVSEGVAAETPMIDIVPRPKPGPAAVLTPRPKPARARHSDSVFARSRAISIGRPLTVAASVIVAFALLLGGAVWMSQKALPGDALYGLKRASESVELATATSDSAKAADYLDFASRRLDEVQGLVKRATTTAAGPGLGANGAVNPSTARLISSTLASSDSDVKSATSLLGQQAVRSSSASPLNRLTAWAPGQLRRLRAIAAAMPDRSLRARAESSAQVVDAAVTRAGQLKPKIGCTCLNGAPTDALGPVPCTVCTPATSIPTVPSGNHHPAKVATAPRTAKTSHGGAVVTADPGVGRPHPQKSTSPPAPPSSSQKHPGLPVPSLPLPTRTLPVTTDSCGANVSLPIIGIRIGLCSGVQISIHP